MYLDRKARELVLRFAYAGQPLSGKTRSLRALLPLLKGSAIADAVFSPREDQGRTWYFDWASYRGGSVQGNAVRCQIITVPGQDTLAQRRQLLIESADVVIFVVDSDPQRLSEASRSYQEILPWLQRAGHGRIPLLIQCNKRDLPNAAPLDRIRRELGLASDHPLFESTATSGRGIRLAFIAALRAACERAGTLQELQTQQSGNLHAESGEQLLELMQRFEAQAPNSAVQATRTAEQPRSVPPVRPVEEPITEPLPVQLAEAARPEPPPSPALEPVGSAATSIAEIPAQRVDAPPPESHPAPASVNAPAPQQSRPLRWNGIGPRPAVMPAQDWHALVGTLKQAAQAGTPANAPSIEPVPEAEQPADVPLAAEIKAAPASAARKRPGPPSFEAPNDRPAVMPMAAWRDWVRAHGGTVHDPLPADSTPVDGADAAALTEAAVTSSETVHDADVQPPASIADPVTADAMAKEAMVAAVTAAPLPPLLDATAKYAVVSVSHVAPVMEPRVAASIPEPAAPQESPEQPTSAAPAAAAAVPASPAVSVDMTTPAPLTTAVVVETMSSPEVADPSTPAREAFEQTAAALLPSVTVAVEEEEVETVLLPLSEQPLANVWPVATWQWLSPQFHRHPKLATCQDGVWSGEVAIGWFASSDALFGDRETGIEALGIEIQRRERARAYLWPHRCLVLCSDGFGYWRLWELIRRATTLDQILQRILLQSGQGKAEQTAGNLLMLGRAYLKACDTLPQSNEPFAIEFTHIAQHEGRLVYTGWLHATALSKVPPRGEPLASLAAQLRAHLPMDLPASTDVLEVCRELRSPEHSGSHKPIADLLCSLLMRYVDARPGRDASAGARQ